MYRKHLYLLLLPLCFSLLFSKGYSASNNDSMTANEALLKQISKGFSQVAKKATPAVVYIESQSPTERQERASPHFKKGPQENPFEYFNDDFINRFFGFPFPNERKKSPEIVRGAGFIISPDGFIVTNFHVVEHSTKLQVTLNNGKKVTATVIGSDPKTDLALIKINEKNLPFLTFGDSNQLEVGDWAIAVGNPFGLQATVTVGIVSAKGRNQLHIADFEDFIQTDAAINPGNSGGPLLNVDGEVVGVNTAIVTGSGGYMGIGFSIPSSMAKPIIDQLKKNGQVVRGFLGVTLQPIDTDLAKFYKLDTTNGALITEVLKGSPAEKAGLKQEDIILAFNGSNMENSSAFRNHVSLLDPGSKLKLKVFREGKIIDVNVTISSTPEEETNATNSPTQKLGLKVQALTPDIAQQYGYQDEEGVVVTQVDPNSPASRASLKKGGLILSVNRRKVRNLEEFATAIKEASKENEILLRVRYGSDTVFHAIYLDEND